MRETTPGVGGFFDAESERYDAAYDRRGSAGRALRRRLEVALGMLGPGPGDVLDAGMGGGRLCQALDRWGWKVSGIDVSPRMVELARARLPHRRHHLVQGSIEALPFADASFDAVVATGVLEYAQLRRAAAELARVLRPAGVAVVSFPNRLAPSALWRRFVLYPAARGAKALVPLGRPAPLATPVPRMGELERALHGAGLRIEASEAVGVRPAPAAVATLLERSGSPLARVLGAQVVLRARKVMP